MASYIKVRTGGLLWGIGLVSLMAHGVSGHMNLILKEPDGTKKFSDCKECRYISRVADRVYVTKSKIPDDGAAMGETPIDVWGYSLGLDDTTWHASLGIHRRDGKIDNFLYNIMEEKKLNEIFKGFTCIVDTPHIDTSRSRSVTPASSIVGSDWSMSSAKSTRNLLLKKPDGGKQFSECGECYYISLAQGEVYVTRSEIPLFQSNDPFRNSTIAFKPEAYEFSGAYKDRKDIYKLMLHHNGREEIYLYQLSADRRRLEDILDGVKDMRPADGAPLQRDTTFSQSEWIKVRPAAISAQKSRKSVGKMFNVQLKSKNTISVSTTDFLETSELSVANKTLRIDGDVRSIIIPNRKGGTTGTPYRFRPEDTLKVFHLLKKINAANGNSYPVMKVTLTIDGKSFRCIGTCYEYVRVAKTIATANNASVIRYHLVGPEYRPFTFEVDHRPGNLFEFDGRVRLATRRTKNIKLKDARSIELHEGQQPVKL